MEYIFAPLSLSLPVRILIVPKDHCLYCENFLGLSLFEEVFLVRLLSMKTKKLKNGLSRVIEVRLDNRVLFTHSNGLSVAVQVLPKNECGNT